MADIGKQHHHNLLSKGLHTDKDEQEEAINLVLNEIDNDARLPDKDHTKLRKHINPDIVKLALTESVNNTSPRYDGIPTTT